MPVVTVQVPAGLYTQQMRQDLVEKITDAVVEVEGIPALRRSTTVLLNEVVDGGWGSGGTAATLAQMKEKYGVA